MTPPKVCVLVLNFNGTEDSRRCLQSLQKLKYPDFGILFIDNGSADTTWKEMVRAFPAVHVLPNNDNLGYAGGNNAGMSWAMDRGYEDVFILNNDIEVDPDCLTEIEAALKQYPEATLASPLIIDRENKSLLHSCGSRINWFRLRPEEGCFGLNRAAAPKNNLFAEIFPGAALLIRGNFLRAGGFFNEKYFLIHEDAELCYRNRRLGHQNLVVPSARVYHALSGTLSKYSRLSAYYSTRNFLFLAGSYASPSQKAQCAAGLIILSFKRAIEWVLGSTAKRNRSAGFFAGAMDFFLAKQGRKTGL